MKRLLCFLCATALTLTLCACQQQVDKAKEIANNVKEDLIPTQTTQTTQHEVALKRGNAVGNVCYDAQLPVVTADGIQSVTVDPTSFGKVTVIHFWGTWCAPSLAEMPYFDAVAKKYGEEMKVVAVHGMMVSAAPDYIAQNYPDSSILFLSDYIPDGNEEINRTGYYTLLGGRNNAYPRTVVLNKQGIITHVFDQKISETELETAVLEAMGRM